MRAKQFPRKISKKRRRPVLQKRSAGGSRDRVAIRAEVRTAKSPLADKIDARRRALGLSKKRLAALAGIDETGLGRLLNGHSDPLTSTIGKLEAALVAEEKRALAHLVALHGTPEQQRSAA
jgi:ribosome-binding protein aMBF1 (putative translation factor)